MGNLAYNRDHVRQIKFNFNLRTDADILAFLDTLENRQGYIKSLIRADIASREALEQKTDEGKEPTP